MAKIQTISLGKQDEQNLDDLVKFFQKKSIATITRSDVIKFLINQTHQVTTQGKFKDAEQFYSKLGIDFDFEIIHFRKEKE